MASPPEEQRLPVLNEVWKSIMKLKNPSVSIVISILPNFPVYKHIFIINIIITYKGEEGSQLLQKGK